MSPLPYPSLRNPVWQRCDNLRDPAVLPYKDGYHLFYSRFSNQQWDQPENWSVARVFTRDFITFQGDTDITPKGFASPGDPVKWGGLWVLPFQSYPLNPTRLYYSLSSDTETWSVPAPFLAEVNDLPWNTRRRAIDPSFVVDGDTLHCFFVGSCWRPDIASLPREAMRHANLIGHATTKDPALEQWEILTPDEPLLGISPEAPDGCENVMIFRTGEQWTMIYSEGLADQHLAVMQSPDLLTWTRLGPIELPKQPWMTRRYGAPFVWREPEGWLMILMGEDEARRTTFGLLGSPDGIRWRLVAARQ